MEEGIGPSHVVVTIGQPSDTDEDAVINEAGGGVLVDNTSEQQASEGLSSSNWDGLSLDNWLPSTPLSEYEELRSLREIIWDSVSEHRAVPCSIHRVPEHMKRDGNWDAYVPQVLSIGPFYQPSVAPDHEERLRSMQKHKRLIILYILQHDHLQRECLEAMKALEEEARACYSESFSSQLQENDFAKMMLLDGCIVLHLLLTLGKRILARRSGASEGSLNQGPGKLWIWNLALYDLLLLENQIPLFIVNKLFDILRTQENGDISVADLALKLFVHLGLPIVCSHLEIRRLVEDRKIHHLLHLFYLSILPSKKPHNFYTDGVEKRYHWIPSATELQEVGIKFVKPKKNENRSFLDIRFHGNMMEIPSIQIYDNNKSLLRNLITFEQYYPDTQMHVTTYAMFMECIIKSPKDVELLRRKQIIVDKMRTEEEVIHFFTRLCSQAHVWDDVNYLDDVFSAVMEYRESRWHKLRSKWVAASAVLAMVLLLLTIIQAFMAVYSYVYPQK